MLERARSLGSARKLLAGNGGGPTLGMIGAGSFATATLLPGLRAAGLDNVVAVSSKTGLSARSAADRLGASCHARTTDEILDDDTIDTVVIASDHASHADLVLRALRAGKHVFCEKPLALDLAGLDEIEAAWRDSQQVLAVGFNRRFSQAMQDVHERLGEATTVVTYRINAGTLPASHWYYDRRQGGRLVGEVCHFIDTASFLGGDAEIVVSPFGIAGDSELRLADDVAVSMRIGEQALAVIAYGSGGDSSMPKEQIDVMSGGRNLVVDDFSRLLVGGEEVARYRSDRKGHVGLLRAFRRSLERGEPFETEAMIRSMRATLLAADALCSPGA